MYKSRTDIKIDGVCSGVAQYFGFDVALVRIIWLLAVFFGLSTGFWAYIVCAIIMPREPEVLDYTSNKN